MTAPLLIQLEKASGFPAAETMYRSVGYNHPIEADSQVVTASVAGQIVGVVRLVDEEGALILRGMMVTPAYQRKGLGAMMLRELEKHIGPRDCYCLPYGWLEEFYGLIGFKKISDDQAPPHLRARLLENRKKYPQLIVMKRDQV